MRVLIQRVLEASVTIDATVKSKIKQGLLILVGIEDTDNQEDINWLCAKITNMRIFSDEQGLMNLSVLDVKGELLVVSQFTLFAKTKKGNRPSYLRSAKPDFAIPMYENFVKTLATTAQKEIQTGEFGSDMKVSLVNDGPVTIWIDSKQN